MWQQKLSTVGSFVYSPAVNDEIVNPLLNFLPKDISFSSLDWNDLKETLGNPSLHEH